MLAMLCRNGVDAFYERAREREMMKIDLAFALSTLESVQKSTLLCFSYVSRAFRPLLYVSRDFALCLDFSSHPPSPAGLSQWFLRGSLVSLSGS